MRRTCWTLAGVILTIETVICPSAHASLAEAETPRITFGVISDIHMRAGKSDWGFPYRDVTSERKFANALQDLHAIDPLQDTLIINGDLTETGSQRDYEDMTKVLHHNPHPTSTLFAIGNHEFYAAYYNKSGKRNVQTFPNGVTEEMCVHRFLVNTGMPSLYYDRWIDGYHFILLGSEQSIITNPRTGDGAYLSTQQLEWLRKKLEQSPTDKPVFVFLHEPIPGSVAGALKHDVNDSSRLITVLASHPQVIVFTGHTHRDLNSPANVMYQNGFTLFNDSSVRNVSGDPIGRASEGLYVKVYQDKMIVIGQDFSRHRWIYQHTLTIAHSPHSSKRAGFQSP